MFLKRVELATLGSAVKMSFNWVGNCMDLDSDRFLGSGCSGVDVTLIGLSV